MNTEPMIFQFKEAFVKPRFKITTVLAGVLIIYAIIILVLFVALYPGAMQGGGGGGFIQKQLTLKSIPIHAVAVLFLTLVYYLLLNLVYAGLKLRLGFLFFLLSALAVGFVLEFYKLTDAVLFRNISFAKFFEGTVFDFLVDLLLSLLFYAALAVLFVFIALQRDEKEKNRKLTEANRQLELEKLQVKNNLLRAQINPHFLHNTLNLLYAKTRQYDKELANGILLLSDSMRYSLDATKQQADLVPLHEEVQHLKNLISLQQLRYNEQLSIWFTLEGNMHPLQIPPLTLITLAENAFKHGELHDSAHPIKIKLSIDADGQRLEYFVSNKKKTGPVELSHGIGLENIKQRLKHAFADRYSLTVTEEEQFYSITLVIHF